MDFIDCLYLRYVNKQFYTIKQNSISSQLARILNKKVGLELNSQFGREIIDFIKKNTNVYIVGYSIAEAINDEYLDDCPVQICVESVKTDKSFRQSSVYHDIWEILEKYNSYSRAKNSGSNRYSYDRREYCGYIGNNEYVSITGPGDYDEISLITVNKINFARSFTFCKNYYNGKVLYVQNIDSIINKWGYLDYSYDTIKEYGCYDVDYMEFDPLHYVLNTTEKFYHCYDIYIDIKLLLALSDPKYYKPINPKNLEKVKIDRIKSKKAIYDSKNGKLLVNKFFGYTTIEQFNQNWIEFDISNEYQNYVKYHEPEYINMDDSDDDSQYY